MAKKHFPFYEIEISKNFPSRISTHIDWKPNTNIIELENALIIEAELPGVNKEDVSITLNNNQEIIIRGQKKQPKLDKKKVTYYLFEREFGAFYKKIVIDFPLDINEIQSKMENGVLTIRIPKKPVAKIPIEIK